MRRGSQCWHFRGLKGRSRELAVVNAISVARTRLSSNRLSVHPSLQSLVLEPQQLDAIFVRPHSSPTPVHHALPKQDHIDTCTDRDDSGDGEPYDNSDATVVACFIIDE